MVSDPSRRRAASRRTACPLSPSLFKPDTLRTRGLTALELATLGGQL
jgi:hypothetical protein